MVTRTVSPPSTFFLPAFAKPNAALADIRDSRYTLDLNCPIGYQSIEQIMEGTKDAWPEDGLCCKLPTACVSDKFIVRPLFVKTEREETMKTKSKSIVLAVWAMTALLAGCQSGNQPTTEQPAEQPATKQAGAAKSGAPKRRPASTEARAETVTVPAGTTLAVRLSNTIDTARASSGEEFEGTLAEPLVARGVEVAPAGSRVTGRVTNAVSSGRLNRPAELSLVLSSLTPEGGRPVEISTSAWAAKGQSHKKRDVEMIGGGAGVGALIGAIAGKGKGAAIGSAVGAGAGTAAAAATGKKEIVLAPETALTFTLTAPVTLEVRRR